MSELLKLIYGIAKRFQIDAGHSPVVRGFLISIALHNGFLLTHQHYVFSTSARQPSNVLVPHLEVVFKKVLAVECCQEKI